MSSASSRYEVELSEVAKKDLAGLQPQIQNRVRLAFRILSNNPRPPLSVKLKGRSGYRIRVGDYRIIYEIFDKKSNYFDYAYWSQAQSLQKPLATRR